MSRDPEARRNEPSPNAGRTARRSFFLLPHRDNLHPRTRLALGASANVVLAAWVLPQIGHMQDPAYSLSNALQATLEVAIPCATLLVLAPVFLLGREIPRLLAIGFSVFPAYVAVVGIGAALQLCAGGN